MKVPFGALSMVLLGLAWGFDDPKPAADRQPHEISLESQALRAFDSLQLTDEQLALFAKLAKETAESERKRSRPKVSDQYRGLLTELNEALVARDDDRVQELDERIERLTESESPEIDDGYAVTNAARQRAPEALKTFKPAQLAAYYGSLAESAHDPLQYLKDSLREVRGLEKDAWRGKRDEIADDVAWLTVGPDPVKWEKLSDRVVALLCKARVLGEEEFKAQEAKLDKEAQDLVGEVANEVVLRHYAERTIAELLSNPRLEAAVKARLK